MKDVVRNLKTVKQCENLAKNADDRGRPDVAALARIRALEIKAAEHEAVDTVEREALQAVYAYEAGLSRIKGKPTRASRTWMMIRRRGIIDAVEHTVSRNKPTSGFEVLEELGLLDYSFEAVVLRHPDRFSEKAIKVSKDRLQGRRDAGSA